MRYILVTGVSSGIGYACVAYFIEQGCHVFGSVRKPEDAARLSQIFGANYTPLLFDVTDSEAIRRAVEVVKAKLGEGENLFGLVVNAGIQIPGPILYLTREEMRYQFDVNVFGTLEVIQYFVPLLRETGQNKPGRIVHVGSTSAAITLPFTSFYSAAKSAMHSLCDTLRRELMMYGVDVIDIYVGPVNNELVAKVAPYKERYKATDYYAAITMRLEGALKKNIPKGLLSEEVAAAIFRSLTVPNPKHRFALNKDWFNTWFIPTLLPHRVLDRIVAKKWKMRPQDFEGR
ncbi:MAG: SDR family NAD(P)-dependent oxidoreductase [Saprospiraceae bacterium]|nr:SDR family NAD(P)-dependent oxidoreductase [Saprospiraceae bacterium]